jgi:hypothetical protein
LLEHDLFRKPPHTFRDHALALLDDALVRADAAVVLAADEEQPSGLVGG